MYKSTGRAVSDLKAHLVLTTKYRRKAITPSMLTRLREIVQALCQEQGCEIVEFNGEADHVHLLFTYYRAHLAVRGVQFQLQCLICKERIKPSIHPSESQME